MWIFFSQITSQGELLEPWLYFQESAPKMTSDLRWNVSFTTFFAQLIYSNTNSILVAGFLIANFYNIDHEHLAIWCLFIQAKQLVPFGSYLFSFFFSQETPIIVPCSPTVGCIPRKSLQNTCYPLVSRIENPLKQQNHPKNSAVPLLFGRLVYLLPIISRSFFFCDQVSMPRMPRNLKLYPFFITCPLEMKQSGPRNQL